MTLVSVVEILNKVHEGHYAVDAFNVNSPEWTKVILLVAEEVKSPAMLGVSEGAAKCMCGFKTVVATVKEVHDSLGITVLAVLHLDHGSYEDAKACIETGFTPIMFDGSYYVFEENLVKSKEMIELTNSKGLSIECEVDGVDDEEDGVASMGKLADPRGYETIIELGVDSPTAGIDNIRGKYPADWTGLNFERLGEIQDVTNRKSLVLHGGPGVPVDQIARTIPLGVPKINVNTELQLVFADVTRKYVEAEKGSEGEGHDPRKLLRPGCDTIKDRATSMMKESGSYDKVE